METNWNALLQILTNKDEDETVVLAAVSDISTNADHIRQHATKETLYRIVETIILLNKDRSDVVKQAALNCLNDEFISEVRDIEERVKKLQEHKAVQQP